MNPLTIIAIIQALLKYGVPAIIDIADLVKSKEDPTPEDIQALFITKKPEDYFKPR